MIKLIKKIAGALTPTKKYKIVLDGKYISKAIDKNISSSNTLNRRF